MTNNDDFLIDLLEDIEELNTFIGNIDEIHLEFLDNIQIWLFDLIFLIENPNKMYNFDVNLEYTKKLEETINNMKNKLPELNNQILPKGTISIARSICRKVERKLNIAQKNYSYIDKNCITFINYLSEYLFYLSRYAHYIINKKDIIYNKSDILTLTDEFESMKL